MTTDTGFPKPILTPIIGPPTAKTIRILRGEVYANAMSIHSERGGAIKGHLALCMSEETYLAIAGTATFDEPIHPGPIVQYEVGATTEERRSTERAHDNLVKEHKTFHTTRTTLVQQIITAIDEIFLVGVADPDYGYATTSPFDLLSHLMNSYGQPTAKEKEANFKLLDADWNPDQPIENLWKRYAECVKFITDTNETIDPEVIMRKVVAVLDKSGVLATAVENWETKMAETPDACTIDALKAHFNRANKDRLSKLTVKTAGFHGANAAEETEKLTKGNGTKPTLGSNGAAQVWYCWSHGLTYTCDHTSKTCSYKGDGHQDDADLLNTKGGFPVTAALAKARNEKRKKRNTAAAATEKKASDSTPKKAKADGVTLETILAAITKMADN